MHALLGVGIRSFVILASAVVLGLSVTLAKQQKNDSPPVETSFGSFTGAFGIITAAIGIAALFFDSIPNLVPLIADGLTALFFLAGGIALTLAMKGVSCTDDARQAQLDRYNNKILNGGCVTIKGLPLCGVATEFPNDDDNGSAQNAELKGRCTRVQADFAFQFIALVSVVGSLAITFLTAKKSGNGVFV